MLLNPLSHIFPIAYNFLRKRTRKFSVALGSLILITILLMPSQAQSFSNKFALIYRGAGTCPGCPEAAAEIATKLHLPIRYIEPGSLTADNFANAAVYI
jgi:hypothetical protein